MSFFNGGAVANEILYTGDPTHQLPEEQDHQYPMISSFLAIMIILFSTIYRVALVHLHSLSSPCSVVTKPRSFLHQIELNLK